jgi:hypothetical protein
MSGASKYDWPALKARYMAGEFISIRHMHNITKISFSTLQNRARLDQWYPEREKMREEAFEAAKARIRNNLMAEGIDRITKILQSTELLRNKGTEILNAEDTIITAADAIRAIDRAASLEIEIFTGKRKGFETQPHSDDEDLIQDERSPEEIRQDVQRRIARLASGKDKIKDTGKLK